MKLSAELCPEKALLGMWQARCQMCGYLVQAFSTRQQAEAHPHDCAEYPVGTFRPEGRGA